MKLYGIKTKYAFNQKTFYSWLRDNQMIEKSETGYVVGPQKMDGMHTIVSERVQDGKVISITQVALEEDQIPQLVKMYENSGLPNLYSERQKVEELDRKIFELSEKVSELEIELQQIK